MKLDLRRYEAADLEPVRDLHKASFATLAKEDHSPEQIAAHLRLIGTDAYAAELLRSNLQIAGDSSGIVATASWMKLDEEPETARIRKVFVRPDRARQGLGKRLVIAAEQAAREHGLKKFFVRANLNAVALYEALGYTPVGSGHMPTVDGVELPVVFMRKG